MDKHKEPYIEQQPEEDALYTKLQRQTQEEAQRLSGAVWTDYNAHDPGVTLAEAANHALAELDYKLGFPLTDYLTGTSAPFDTERAGLFLPLQAYTTRPVTEDDYRRILLAHIPEADSIEVHCSPETGGYTIGLVLSPFCENESGITERVRALFHSRRNLCEWLEKVEIARPDTLDFEADFEIMPGEDAATMLARVYQCILSYLSDRETMYRPDSPEAADASPEEWLEDTEDGLRVVLKEEAPTEHGLYQRLLHVQGVRSFHTCYLKKDGVPQTRLEGFSLHIPADREDLEHIHVRCGLTEPRIDMGRFLERLRGFHFTQDRFHERTGRKQPDVWSMPQSTYRDIYSHYPIACDLPSCYGGALSATFGAYVALYDKLIQDGLKETERLPRLLSLAEKDMGSFHDRDTLRQKSRYLDFLDNMYGMESNPTWLTEENSYGETPEETLCRRAGFLRNAARLAKDRSGASDILHPDETCNTPTIKKHFCLLLGLDPNNGRTVSDVLPKHNLRLSEEPWEGHGMAVREDSLLIGGRMLPPDKVQAVEYRELPDGWTHEDCRRTLLELPFFNENLLPGDLFRGGTDLGGYRIAETGKEEYLLVYRHREHGGWTNLGQGSKPDRLEMLANVLRHFLRELNRKSETLYVVEPVLVDRSCPFEVVFVLPAWTCRFHRPRFREKCRELLRSITPAHLTGKVCWLGVEEMREFEIGYHRLMYALSDSRFENERKGLLEAIGTITAAAQETQGLDDTH